MLRCLKSLAFVQKRKIPIGRYSLTRSGQPKPLAIRLKTTWDIPKHIPNRTILTPNGATNESVFGTKSFEDLGLNDEMVEALFNDHKERPTVAQELSIPYLLQAPHPPTILADRTGTGKTLAFLLPLIQRLKAQEKEKDYKLIPFRPRAVIFVPNRELAIQIAKCIKSISHTVKIKSGTIAGLYGYKSEKNLLKSGLDIVVCSPGRFVEHHMGGNFFLSRVDTVIVDEVDTMMMDDSFFENLSPIFQHLKSKEEKGIIVNYIFSCASLTEPLLNRLKKTFGDVRTLISSSIHKILPNLYQEWIYVTSDKNEKLLHLIKSKTNFRIIIFCNTIKSCRYLHHYLTENKYKAACYHGGIPAAKRRTEYESFSKGDVKILVTTDIASRGLDLNVDHVIMFDFPHNAIDYIHRIGRTARAGQKGRVSNLILKGDRILADRLRRAIENNENLENLHSSADPSRVRKSRILSSHISENE